MTQQQQRTCKNRTKQHKREATDVSPGRKTELSRSSTPRILIQKQVMDDKDEIIRWQWASLLPVGAECSGEYESFVPTRLFNILFLVQSIQSPTSDFCW